MDSVFECLVFEPQLYFGHRAKFVWIFKLLFCWGWGIEFVEEFGKLISAIISPQTGMCLSMRAAGAPDVTIHGPKGCMDMYEATKSFIVMHEFNVIGHDEGDGIYDDNAVTVRHVNLTSSGEQILPPEPKYSPWKPGEL